MGLNDRHKKAVDSAKSGGGFIFKDLPKVEFYKHEEGFQEVNVVPFVMKNRWNPEIFDGAEVGELNYVFNIWVHRKVGPRDKSVICLKRNYDKACPCCDKAKELYDKGDEDAYRDAKASQRSFYFFEVNEKVKFYEVSHWLFTKHVVERWDHILRKDGSDEHFADTENGRTLEFKATKGKQWWEFSSFDFSRKTRKLDDSIVDKTFDPAEYIVVNTAQEIDEMLNSVDDDFEEKEETEEVKEESKAPLKKKKKKALSAKKECPVGLEFGSKDHFDEYEECDECEIYSDCKKAARGE